MRLELIDYKNIPVLHSIHCIVYQEFSSPLNAEKHLSVIVNMYVKIRILNIGIIKSKLSVLARTFNCFVTMTENIFHNTTSFINFIISW